jgi:hypothetical protein
VFAAQARFPSENVRVAGESTQFTRVGDEGSKAIFSFCPVCGDTVYYRTVGDDTTIAIPVGAFADPGFPPPRVSVYEERKHSWVVMPEDMEHIA